MGEPLPGLSPSELNQFVVGLSEFNKPLSQADGLGPVFNDTSCGTCHAHPTVGGFSTSVVTRFGDVGPPFDPLASLDFATQQSSKLTWLYPSFSMPFAAIADATDLISAWVGCGGDGALDHVQPKPCCALTLCCAGCMPA